MGIASWLGLGKELADPINAVGNLYTTDKERLAAEASLAEIKNRPVMAQLSNNAIFAASTNIFNSGWQSLIGWTAGFLVLLYYAPQIIIATYVWGKYCIDTQAVIPYPIKSDEILNLVYILFGVGAHSLIKKPIQK